MVHTMNRITKQIVSAVLVAGFMIGAVMLITKEIGPKWSGYSAFGSVGLIIAGIIILGMLRNIWKGDHDDWKGWQR